jgi:hypothetical protein
VVLPCSFVPLNPFTDRTWIRESAGRRLLAGVFGDASLEELPSLNREGG